MPNFKDNNYQPFINPHYVKHVNLFKKMDEHL